jgi:Ca-activated chloride channel family protein
MFQSISQACRVFALSLPLVVGQGAVGQSVMTFEKVVEYLQLDVDQAKIAKMVQASPTKFVLGSQQVEQLKQAGANESLIQLLQTPAAVTAGSDVGEFVIILDCSGSMNDRLPDGSSKWDAARRAAVELIKSIPEGRQLSLIAYGLDASRECKSIDILRTLSPLQDHDKTSLERVISGLRASGHTPISGALRVAGQQLSRSGLLSSVVLITDGMETCQADPVAEASRLASENQRFSLHVIGFCMSDRDADQVSKISSAGRGTYYDAKNLDELMTSVRKVEQQLVAPTVAEPQLPENLSPLDRLLIEQLSDGSMDVREAAAKSIRERKVQAAVPALVKMTHKAPWGGGIWGYMDREAAILAVKELAPEQVNAAISGGLKAELHDVRKWAAEAFGKHQLVAASPAAEARLLSMTDKDISLTLIQGTVEAELLFDGLTKLSPERLETVILQLMRSKSSSVRAWATSKLNQLPK